uniref:Uncharacterized protein n=1 Tax=Oryza punctata TaxID=4537 RepID=A0A0E0KIR4_ORYPU
MPGPRRSFFACAAVGRWVFVAGGHDEEKNALRSAVAYDADADAWVALPDMATERDEARDVCVGGRFVVVGGYPTEAQGRFVGFAEAFDSTTWAWGPVQEHYLIIPLILLLSSLSGFCGRHQGRRRCGSSLEKRLVFPRLSFSSFSLF